MVNSLFGLPVARAIPESALAGVATGRYTVHGGVIRWAAGTPRAGQIVCHLFPAFGSTSPTVFTGIGLIAQAVMAPLGLISTVLSGLTLLNTFSILKAAKQAVALAEMNLAVTQAGFLSLSRRLDQLEVKLDEIKSSVTVIRTMLELTQRAELRIALEQLNEIEHIHDPTVRRELLVHSAMTLGKIRLLYEQRQTEASTMPEALTAEEYFCLAMLAQARCYAELGQLAMARRLLMNGVAQWRTAAQPMMQRHMLGQYPEKYLGSQFATDISTAELIACMDFAYGETKGLGWIDELRAKGDPWYFYKELTSINQARRTVRSSDRDEIVELHRTHCIPAMRKLIAREAVLETYLAQYELMEQQQLTPQEVEQQLALVSPDQLVDDFLILVPTAEEVLA